jgi:hypothetical protein
VISHRDRVQRAYLSCASKREDPFVRSKDRIASVLDQGCTNSTQLPFCPFLTCEDKFESERAWLSTSMAVKLMSGASEDAAPSRTSKTTLHCA